MPKKYKLTSNTKLAPDGKTKLYQIEALRDIPMHGVQKGDLGGWIDVDGVLSHYGNCWITSGCAYGFNSWVSEDALVIGDQTELYRAHLQGASLISGAVVIKGSSSFFAQVYDEARVSGRAKLLGCAVVCGNAVVRENATIDGRKRHVMVGETALVGGDATIADGAKIKGIAEVGGTAVVQGYKTELTNGVWNAGVINWSPNNISIKPNSTQTSGQTKQKEDELHDKDVQTTDTKAELSVKEIFEQNKTLTNCIKCGKPNEYRGLLSGSVYYCKDCCG